MSHLQQTGDKHGCSESEARRKPSPALVALEYAPRLRHRLKMPVALFAIACLGVARGGIGVVAASLAWLIPLFHYLGGSGGARLTAAMNLYDNYMAAAFLVSGPASACLLVGGIKTLSFQPGGLRLLRWGAKYFLVYSIVDGLLRHLWLASAMRRAWSDLPHANPALGGAPPDLVPFNLVGTVAWTTGYLLAATAVFLYLNRPRIKALVGQWTAQAGGKLS